MRPILFHTAVLVGSIALGLVFIAAAAIGAALGDEQEGWGATIGIVLVGIPVCAFFVYATRRIGKRR